MISSKDVYKNEYHACAAIRYLKLHPDVCTDDVEAHLYSLFQTDVHGKTVH
jgi:hypothetical protein